MFWIQNHDQDNPPEYVMAAIMCQNNRESSVKCAAGCAAGMACTAPSSADLATLPHRCWGCKLRVHSLVLCGMSLDVFLVAQPYRVGRLLPSGRIIKEDADNEMHCVCFTCIGKMTAEERAEMVTGNTNNLQKKGRR